MSDQELEAAIKEIRANCTPTDVFSRDEILDWVRKNEDPTEVFSIATMLTSIRFNKVEETVNL